MRWTKTKVGSRENRTLHRPTSKARRVANKERLFAGEAGDEHHSFGSAARSRTKEEALARLSFARRSKEQELPRLSLQAGGYSQAEDDECVIGGAKRALSSRIRWRGLVRPAGRRASCILQQRASDVMRPTTCGSPSGSDLCASAADSDGRVGAGHGWCAAFRAFLQCSDRSCVLWRRSACKKSSRSSGFLKTAVAPFCTQRWCVSLFAAELTTRILEAGSFCRR